MKTVFALVLGLSLSLVAMCDVASAGHCGRGRGCCATVVRHRTVVRHHGRSRCCAKKACCTASAGCANGTCAR